MEFKRIYDKIKSSCGDVIIVENMALILHRDVLRFEFEALQNWDTLKTILTK
jgi:lysyl-tRNA synthetase class I